MKQAQSGYWQRKRTGSPKAPIVSVQSLSRVWLCNSMDCTCQASLSLIISRSLPKLMFTPSVMWSSHLILWHPLPLLPSIFPSIRDFSNESSIHISWPKYWSYTIYIWYKIHIYFIPNIDGKYSKVYSNSCPLNRWCHPPISSSVIPFSSPLQSFPASGYFQISQLFTSGGQSIGV